MASAQRNINSYRLIWNISEKKKNLFGYLQSHPVTIDNSKWTLKMYRFPSNSSEYNFYLRCSSKDEKKVLRSMFYLLSTDNNFELQNISKFGARMTGRTKITDKKTMLVCAFDVSCSASDRNSVKWLEGRTKELDMVQHPISSGNNYKNYSIQCNNAMKQKVNLKLTNDSAGTRVKSNASGLGNGECLVVDWCFGNSFYIGPNETTLLTYLLGNELYICCQSFEFKEMTIDRISEIAGKMQTSFAVSLLNKDRDGIPTLESTPNPIETKFQSKNNTEITEATAATDTNVHSSSNSASPADNLLSICVRSFRENKFCNITIKVLNGGYEIRAHKLVLVSGSTVWRQLLNNDDQLSIITVPVLERKIVEELITFIYDGSVPKSPVDADQLLIAAVTYGVDGLKDWCEQQLMHTINIESAVNLMLLAHRYNASALFDKIVAFVQQNFTELQQRDEWKSMFFLHPESAMELVKKLL